MDALRRFRISDFSFGVFNRSQLSRQSQVLVLDPRLFARLPVTLPHIIRHFRQRSAGEKNLIDALTFHQAGVVVCDCAAASAKDRDVARALAAQLPDDFGKEIDVSPVVTGNADGRDIFLDGGAYDVARITMKSQVNDLDAVPDNSRLIVLMALSWPSQIGTAVEYEPVKTWKRGRKLPAFIWRAIGFQPNVADG